ncbi:hypothetical protein HQ529_00335 [Candidatus Woesearchaeota archaeon]|nr:hypothetical protein [Candidatus Woesearchaeota archaeon]
MNEFIFIGVGVLGGFVRALYGLFKAVNSGYVVNGMYFLITLIISGVIGGLLGFVFNMDYRVAGLAGYAGTDMLESIFKSSFGRTIIFKKK